jgi:hypothetical protein
LFQHANDQRESAAVAAAAEASGIDQPTEDFESIYSRSSPNLSQHSGGGGGGGGATQAVAVQGPSGLSAGRSGQASLPVGASACSLANQVKTKHSIFSTSTTAVSKKSKKYKIRRI